MRYQRAEPPLKIDGPTAARNFFAQCFAEQNPLEESLWVAHLDDQARCIHLSHYPGDPCGADFPLREIVRDAALYGSTAMLIAHNHPSGDASPSAADLRATGRLAAVTSALSCRLVDHLVFAGADCASLRALGYL